MGKLSLLLQKQQEEQAKSDLPERTRQEPTVPLTARAVGGGGGGGGRHFFVGVERVRAREKKKRKELSIKAVCVRCVRVCSSLN